MGKYKAVFFDWDDTLWDFRANALEALQAVYDGHGLNRWFDSFDHFLGIYVERNRQLWEEYALGLIKKEYLRVERFRYPLACVSAPVTDRLALRMDSDFLRTTSVKTRLVRHAADVVRRLSGQVPIVVISNGFTDVQHGKIERSGLKPFLSHVVLSEEVGVAKSDRRIFEHALRLARCRAGEVLMVGDGYASDITGARNAGIDQFYFTSRPKMGEQATYVSDNLLDVERLF